MPHRPKLNPAPLPQVFPEPGVNYITCSPGQWDALLQGAYDAGWTLLEIKEVNGKEKAVRAWKKQNASSSGTGLGNNQRKET